METWLILLATSTLQETTTTKKLGSPLPLTNAEIPMLEDVDTIRVPNTRGQAVLETVKIFPELAMADHTTRSEFENFDNYDERP